MLNSVSKKSIIILRIRFSLIFSVITFFSGFIGIFSIILSIICILSSILIYVIFVLIYSPMDYKARSYQIDKKGVSVHYGVIMSKNTLLKFHKLQYIELIQSPSQKIFSVCTLIFHVAGSKTKLSNIDLSTGCNIKDIIMRSVINEI